MEPRKHYYLLDTLLEKALESGDQKNLRDAVRRAAEKQEKELTRNLNAARNRVSRLDNQKSAMIEKYSAALGEIQPIFTPKEIAALDIRAVRTINKLEADRLEKIVSQAEKNNRVARIQDLLGAAAKELQLFSVNLAQNQEAKISQENESPRERQTNGQAQDISSRDAASGASLRASDKSAESVHEKATVKEKGRTR